MVDLLVGAHAGGGDDGLAGLADVAQQVVVGERGRGDLVDRRIELLHEVDRRLVPGRDQPGGLERLAEGGDLEIVVVLELEAALQVAVGVAEGIGTRGRELGRGVDDLHGALLELDGVAAGGHGDGDEALGQVDVAVVIDADLCDDIAGMARAKLLVSDGYAAHRCSWFPRVTALGPGKVRGEL
jgi:hypothetical protein